MDEETLSPVMRDTMFQLHHLSYAKEFIDLGERQSVIIDRPGVAGAVLQTASSFTD